MGENLDMCACMQTLIHMSVCECVFEKEQFFLNPLTAMALTSEVFPAFCKPTRESSISCLKNKLKRNIVKNDEI